VGATGPQGHRATGPQGHKRLCSARSSLRRHRTNRVRTHTESITQESRLYCAHPGEARSRRGQLRGPFPVNWVTRTPPRWQYRSVPDASSDGNAEPGTDGGRSARGTTCCAISEVTSLAFLIASDRERCDMLLTGCGGVLRGQSISCLHYRSDHFRGRWSRILSRARRRCLSLCGPARPHRSAPDLLQVSFAGDPPTEKEPRLGMI
jgi:hypothetical protein